MKRIAFFLTIFLFVVQGLLLSQSLIETHLGCAVGSGARALGMGGAFIAVADDATATTWNPGGLGQIEYLELSMVGSYFSFNNFESDVIVGNSQTGTINREGDSITPDFFGVSVPLRPFKDSDFKIVLQYSYQRLINKPVLVFVMLYIEIFVMAKNHGTPVIVDFYSGIGIEFKLTLVVSIGVKVEFVAVIRFFIFNIDLPGNRFKSVGHRGSTFAHMNRLHP